VADVFLPDGASLNRELVKEGMAWWFEKYAPNDKVPEKLESEAREAKRGLWRQENPVAPWEWRTAPATSEVIGNRKSLVYHASNCPSVGRMKDRNRVSFKTVLEAEAAGNRRAGDCLDSGGGK
jgi:Staphylococcal nuclease homologue